MERIVIDITNPWPQISCLWLVYAVLALLCAMVYPAVLSQLHAYSVGASVWILLHWAVGNSLKQ